MFFLAIESWRSANCSYKVEQEVDILFDNEETGVLEVEAGLLCRRQRTEMSIAMLQDFYTPVGNEMQSLQPVKHQSFIL